MVVHLLVNHQATQGAEAFNKASNFMESLPFLIIVEFLFIYIPLLYHGLFGIHIAFTAKENVGHYSIFRNWMFFFPSEWYLNIYLYWYPFMANTFTKSILRQRSELRFNARNIATSWMEQYFILFVLLLLCSTLQMAYGHS